MQPTSDMFWFYVLTEQKNGLPASEVVQKLNLAWLDEAPSRATIFRWYRDFVSGSQTSLSHATIPGQLYTDIYFPQFL